MNKDKHAMNSDAAWHGHVDMLCACCVCIVSLQVSKMEALGIQGIQKSHGRHVCTCCVHAASTGQQDGGPGSRRARETRTDKHADADARRPTIAVRTGRLVCAHMG